MGGGAGATGVCGRGRRAGPERVSEVMGKGGERGVPEPKATGRREEPEGGGGGGVEMIAERRRI